MKKMLTCLLAATLGMLASPAYADMGDILNKGKVRIGTIMDNPPFGQIGPDGEPIGFEIELGQIIGEKLGVEVEVEAIVAANRIPFLLTDKIDLILACMAPTPERAAQVMFSSPYSYQFTAVWGSKDTAVEGAESLEGLSVAVPKGTTQDLSVSALEPAPNVLRFENDGASIAAFLSGQADLFATISTQAYAVAQQNPDKQIEAKFKLLPAPCSIALRQGDFQMVRWLDTLMLNLRLNGELERLHQKYIGASMGDLPVL